MIGQPHKNKAKKRRILCLISGAVLFIYVLSYCILSCHGEYVLGRSGKKRYAVGLAAPDIELWQPQYVYGQLFYAVHGRWTYRGNLMGVIYCPLVVIDQKYVHKTRWFDADRQKKDS